VCVCGGGGGGGGYASLSDLGKCTRIALTKILDTKVLQASVKFLLGLFSMCHACLKSDTPVSRVLILFLPNASASVCFFTTKKYEVADFLSIDPSKQIGVLYVSPNAPAMGAFKASKYIQSF
jgi:hypothetical protein